MIIAPVLEKSKGSRELLASITTLILFFGIYTGMGESRSLSLALFLLGALNFITTWWKYAFWSDGTALVH
jgi:hypothetical protein